MVATAMTKHKIAPQERACARAVSELLARLGAGGEATLTVTPQGGAPESVAISASLAQTIREVSALLQTGENVSIFADDPEITPEQASEILGMSRPMVVQRIKCGDLKSRMVGAHHRISLTELLAFRERESARMSALEEFTRLGEEMYLKHGD